ncbi:MAG: RDD family protein [Nitriliruptor sp.]|nr:MAG: RDD family protein [Nitriliruptor sp.]
MTRDSSATADSVERIGFLPRFGAELIDLLAMWGLIAVSGAAVWGAMTAVGAGDATTVAIVLLVGATVGVGYWVILHAHANQTLGKRAIGAVVTDTQLRPIGYGRAFARLVAEIASAIPLNLGYLWPLWDRERQTFHDKLAGTLVVRKADLPTPATG